MLEDKNDSDFQDFEVLDNVIDVTQQPERSYFKSILLLLLLIAFTLVSLISLYNYLKQAPTNFPINTEIVIEPGTSVKQIINLAKRENLIRSELAMYLELRLSNNGTLLKAGTYTFTEPKSLEELIEKLIAGGQRSDLVRFTHIEGETVEQLAQRAEQSLLDFDAGVFLALAKSSEGSLFPETYLIPRDFSEEDLFLKLKKTFSEKLEPYQDEIENNKLTLEKIIILASILEREANSPESKKMVAGILLNRLEIGMALQVDASIGYVLDKPLSQLTAKDLEIDSLYNTYLYPGLTPTPISNPGLESILAVLRPTVSEYMFYITGDDGNFYYAETFDGHRVNITRYLR
jgi:UPF0755 protein